MLFLVVLLVSFVGAWAMPARFGGRSVANAARHALGIALVFAGVSHFTLLDSFRAHLPSWLPFRDPMVYATGVIEVVGGLALFVRRYRTRVGLAVAAYLVLVFPANVYVAVAGVDVPGSPDGWYHWVRLPLQALFVWWALRSTGVSIRFERESRGLTPARAAQ